MANIHRDKDAKPYAPTDFMPWHEEKPAAAEAEPEATKMNPEDHSRLLMAALFKKVD